MKTKHLLQSIFAIAVICATVVPPVTQACTRAVYLGPEDTV
jgi:hypothetical protein